MNKFAKISSPMLILMGCLQAIPAAAQTANRTWVSGAGDDGNPCSLAAPCKSFAGALTKTVANGIINCLAPGGFGAVNITKSVTIDCGGVFGGVLAPGFDGITINGAGIVVNIRNLSIEGMGTGRIGIKFINGAVLRIEKTNIHGFQASQAIGVNFAPPAGLCSRLDSAIVQLCCSQPYPGFLAVTFQELESIITPPGLDTSQAVPSGLRRFRRGAAPLVR